MEEIQVPPERSPPARLTSLDAIAEDAKFGNVQGPAAFGKSTYAPFGLWKAPTALCPDMLVIHAVAEYKLRPVQRRREGEWSRASTQNPMFELATMTYGALLQKLKKNSTPTKGVPQQQGWGFDQLPRRVLVILDVDSFSLGADNLTLDAIEANVIPALGSIVARFLSGRPHSRNLVYAKAQLAAVLTIGLREIIHVDADAVRLEDIKTVKLVGFTSSIAYMGTLWMVLALIRTVPSLSHDPGQSIIKAKAQKAMQLAVELASSVLDAHETQLAPPATRLELLSGEDVRILYALVPASIARSLIDWRKIRAENSGEPIVIGFYTHAARDSKNLATVITDWNWIPESTVRRWADLFGSGSLSHSTTMYPLGVNDDEV
ncbi:hypothetical protein QQZ08_008541 [Neonectria magnoliae]|uniref:Uncharacterized protein n=1 Tax=Neonectria magnoliae TaxID=2732573 RepID=A0ABR1HTT0_9HYPO